MDSHREDHGGHAHQARRCDAPPHPYKTCFKCSLCFLQKQIITGRALWQCKTKVWWFCHARYVDSIYCPHVKNKLNFHWKMSGARSTTNSKYNIRASDNEHKYTNTAHQKKKKRNNKGWTVQEIRMGSQQLGCKRKPNTTRNIMLQRFL